MKEIKEKKMVTEEQTVYKYVSDDGKFESESRWKVDEYEREQRRPYFEEYKKRLNELVDYVNENKAHLEPCECSFRDFNRMVLFLLFRKDEADAYEIENYNSSDGGWKVGDF